jgi:hypothetical protein
MSSEERRAMIACWQDSPPQKEEVKTEEKPQPAQLEPQAHPEASQG